MISIIIPVYNVAEYIERAILSVVAQTYRNIELIVVDDCGSDNSIEIIKNLMDEGKTREIPVTFISHEKNRGLSAARNSGLLASRAEYVFFLDADDIIPSYALERHINVITEYNVDITFANYYKVTGGKKKPNIFIKKERVVSPTLAQEQFYRGRLPISAWNKLIRREFLLLNHILFKEGILYEDGLWIFQVLLAQPTIVTIPECTYDYIIRGNSITTSSKNVEKKIESRMIILSEIESLLKQRNHRSDILSNYLSKERYKAFRHMLMTNLDVQIKKGYYKFFNNIELIGKKTNKYEILSEFFYYLNRTKDLLKIN